MLVPLLLLACNFAAALPAPVVSRADAATRQDLSKCPGYAASNVVVTETSLTADLKLDGAKCNVYGDDLEELKLVVEHQTSECSSASERPGVVFCTQV
jgi:alpha-glucosidase